jgi:hypothetical protein
LASRHTGLWMTKIHTSPRLCVVWSVSMEYEKGNVFFRVLVRPTSWAVSIAHMAWLMGNVTSNRMLAYLNPFFNVDVDIDVRRPRNRICLGRSPKLSPHAPKFSGVDSIVHGRDNVVIVDGRVGARHVCHWWHSISRRADGPRC